MLHWIFRGHSSWKCEKEEQKCIWKTYNIIKGEYNAIKFQFDKENLISLIKKIIISKLNNFQYFITYNSIFYTNPCKYCLTIFTLFAHEWLQILFKFSFSFRFWENWQISYMHIFSKYYIFQNSGRNDKSPAITGNAIILRDN